jgi:hypothetical protein
MEDPHTWATRALRALIARSIRALCAELDREGRSQCRLACVLRDQAQRTGWL